CWRMRVSPRVRNEDFDASSFSSGPFFDGSILFACQRPKMQSDGKISALRRPKFMWLVILSTTVPISRFYLARRDDSSKQELIRLGQFFSVAAPIGARNRFWLMFFARSDRNSPICFWFWHRVMSREQRR